MIENQTTAQDIRFGNSLQAQSSKDKIEIKEFRTEFRDKKRKRREAFVIDDEQQWLSFSSGEEYSLPNERGDSRYNFPNTENKKQYKFFSHVNQGHNTKIGGGV